MQRTTLDQIRTSMHHMTAEDKVMYARIRSRLKLDRTLSPVREVALLVAGYITLGVVSIGVGTAIGTLYRDGRTLPALTVLLVAVYAGHRAWRSVRD